MRTRLFENSPASPLNNVTDKITDSGEDKLKKSDPYIEKAYNMSSVRKIACYYSPKDLRDELDKKSPSKKQINEATKEQFNVYGCDAPFDKLLDENFIHSKNTLLIRSFFANKLNSKIVENVIYNNAIFNAKR